MPDNYLKLNDIECYRIAFRLSNYVWSIVINWESFPKRVVGAQFAGAADSISANIAEGFGRHFKKYKIKFYSYSKGSLKESLDWNEKAKVRKLITTEEYDHIFGELNKLPKSINSLIKFTNEKLPY
jgi:four helix bundle protein